MSYLLTSRTVLQFNGGNGLETLFQGLFTADIKKIKQNGFCFSALLNRKGRFLFDFFIYRKEKDFFIDIDSGAAQGFADIVKKYDLLEEVNIGILESLWKVEVEENFLDNWKRGIFEGRKIISSLVSLEEYKTENDYNLQRIRLCLPEGKAELISGKSIILEHRYEEAKGIDFDKGCYVGQELMTIIKRRGEVRKATYCLEGNAPPRESETLTLLSSFNNFHLILGYKADFENSKTIEIDSIIYKIYK
jgi:folate-binding protein YgfZ